MGMHRRRWKKAEATSVCMSSFLKQPEWSQWHLLKQEAVNCPLCFFEIQQPSCHLKMAVELQVSTWRKQFCRVSSTFNYYQFSWNDDRPHSLTVYTFLLCQQISGHISFIYLLVHCSTLYPIFEAILRKSTALHVNRYLLVSDALDKIRTSRYRV